MSVVLVQTLVGDYRQAVLEQVIESLGRRFHVYAGAEYFDPTTRTGVRLGPHLTTVRNHFFIGRRLLWQSGMWGPVFRADSTILEFNPRILSVWAILVARRLLGRRSVLWGHAWPRGGRERRTVWFRQIMGRLGNGIIVYTESQAEELRRWMPGVWIIAAPNALYPAEGMKSAVGESPPTDFIYVGRLVPAKKPSLLLAAFLKAGDRLPADSRLIFVGDGPERSRLERLTQGAGAVDRVEFTGHVADPAALKTLYARSIASVSPGYVGLSITQSFSFGVPMIVARNEPHAPEIEAAVEGKNSVIFEEDSPEALAEALTSVWNSRDRWVAARDAIAEDCAARYSADLMASRLVEAALGK